MCNRYFLDKAIQHLLFFGQNNPANWSLIVGDAPVGAVMGAVLGTEPSGDRSPANVPAKKPNPWIVRSTAVLSQPLQRVGPALPTTGRSSLNYQAAGVKESQHHHFRGPQT
jgi:hypothetical protein